MNEEIKRISAEISAMAMRMEQLRLELESLARRVGELEAEEPIEEPIEEPEEIAIEEPGAEQVEEVVESEPAPKVDEGPKQIRLPLSDRFMFQRELFGNDAELMATVLHHIEQMGSADEAKAYLMETIGLKPDNDCAKTFLAAISRHFDPRTSLLA